MPQLTAGPDYDPAFGQEQTSLEPAADGGSTIAIAWLTEWSISIIAGLGLFYVLRAFAIEAYRIPTGSMEDTLLAGDFVLVNKAIYGSRIPFIHARVPGFAEPHRGDIIVFVPPHERDKNYVKRLVAAPGDTIEMQDKIVRVNGKAVEEPFAQYRDPADAMTPGGFWQCRYTLNIRSEICNPSRDNWGPIVVPANRYLVLGDNRDDSEDSRYWGFVGRESILGRPLVIYFSLRRSDAGHLTWKSRVRWDRVGLSVR
jgi:signal peptidase I